MRRVALPALCLLAAVLLSGCVFWPFGSDAPESGDADNGDGAANGSDGGEPAPQVVTFDDAVARATERVRAEHGDAARLTRANATVDADGTLLAPATLLFHVNGPEAYPDAWRSAYATLDGAFVEAVVPAEPGGRVTVAPLAGPLPTLQGVLRDAGAPPGSARDALVAGRGAVPAPSGTWRLVYEGVACPDEDTGAASWRVENATHAARVSAVTGSFCEGPDPVDVMTPHLVVIADVPHGSFLVEPGASVTAPVDVRVSTVTAPDAGLRFLLAASGAGPDHAPPPGETRIPEGFDYAVDPDVVTVTGTGIVRVNVTISVPADAAEGLYRFVMLPRSDAPAFSGGQDEPLRVLVRAS